MVSRKFYALQIENRLALPVLFLMTGNKFLVAT